MVNGDHNEHQRKIKQPAHALIMFWKLKDTQGGRFHYITLCGEERKR